MAKKIIGLLILIVGIIFLLTNIGILQMNIGTFIFTFWPVILIYLGLRQMLWGLIYFTRKLRDGKWQFDKLFWGMFLLASGIVLQGNKLEYFNISLGQFWSWTWPILIIYFGITLIFNHSSNLIVVDLSGKKNKDVDIDYFESKKRKANSKLKSKQLIGDIRFGKTPWLIEDLQTWVGIGDISVDLSTAMLTEGENSIDLSGVIGNIKVFVPDTLPVKINVDVKLGDIRIFDNKQSGASRFVSYESDNYALANKKVAIFIQLSVGDVRVKRVD